MCPSPFPVARPLTARCARLLDAREHACIGISPFNSYFTESRIFQLAQWAARTFEKWHLFVPDAATVHTLEALRYPPERAATKARRQNRYLMNKIRRALDDLGITDPDQYVLHCHTLAGNSRFRQLLSEAEHRFRGDPAFAAECLEASRWVLDRRLPEGTAPTQAQLRCAVRYFLFELPLFVDTAGIAAARRSVFCYHQSVPFLRRFYQRELSWHPEPGQGFVVVTDDAPEGRSSG